jgi:diguanylate cyclase (GGDEF)-like protein/PAS domain S-box-containing protein
VFSKRVSILPDIPAGLESWVANRLVSAHFRIVTSLVLGHLLNVGMVLVSFWHLVAPLPLLCWAGAVVLVCGQRFLMTVSRDAKTGRRNPNAIIRRLEANSVFLAILAAGAIVRLWGVGSAMHDILLAIVGTTMVAAATVTMRTIHRAAVAYIVIVSGSLTFMLFSDGSIEGIAAAILTGVSSVLVARMALVAYNLFVTRIVRERQLNASMETVQMLLNDFQDHGTDWLFELDREFRVLSPSNRFSEAYGLASENLNGWRFDLLFDDTPERQQLRDHLLNRRGFKGLALPLVKERSGRRRWWSVSGRPVESPTADGVWYRGVISDVSAEKQAEERVRHMAHYDGLTGLPNRLMFNNALHRLVAEGVVAERAVLLLIDVDNFKAINDSLGHPVGDRLLKAISERIIDCISSTGLGGEGHIVARLGGDEFAILMGGEDSGDHAIRLAEQLVHRMSEPFDLDDHQITTGISIGLAISPFDGESGESLLRNADLALYCAKDHGRGRWERFEAGLDVAARERLLLERDLRMALARDEMRLYFQPLVDVSNGRQAGFEALLRWENAERGMVMPDDFIAIAEETGLIVPLGEWVIRTAMNEAASWHEPLTVAVNVSPVQMRSPNLLPTIVGALAESGLDPARFEVEITEGVLLNDSEANMALLHKMRSLGIKIALDDFGTGYSSLNYLRTFPFDKIKIDRSFVNDLENREDSRAIVSAVINLARDLGIATLAEGVEQAGQLAQLREEGCSLAQGWLFGRAVPAEELSGLKSVPRRPASRRAA